MGCDDPVIVIRWYWCGRAILTYECNVVWWKIPPDEIPTLLILHARRFQVRKFPMYVDAIRQAAGDPFLILAHQHIRAVAGFERVTEIAVRSR